ncbi:TRAFAC clade GTPase domain-containing protein [Micromonospora haikouensis]|uniref:TRAFAC clade GTPase domain-containing protein n=1 Tax=Micromonospora haikouensis TaxID=686309 RepID=UPI003D728CA2
MFVRDATHGRVMDIVMLGPSGVGKTSMLASLYDQFPEVVGESALELTVTDGRTRSDLQQYRVELERFARGGPARDPGVNNTKLLRQYLIGLGTAGRRPPQMTLRFTDMPGGHLNRPDHPERRRLDEILPTAGVIFIAIDSPALMERGGTYNTEINQPRNVADFVRDALAGPGNKLVVLVALKCERYTATAVSRTRLATEVKKVYRPLLDAIDAAAGGRCGVVLTCVQTVGSMVFSRYEVVDGNRRAYFRLADPGAKYAPQDTDQPLRWMLRFVVNSFRARQRTLGEALGDWWHSTDYHLTQALRSFGASVRTEDGFEVLHHHPHLELP